MPSSLAFQREYFWKKKLNLTEKKQKCKEKELRKAQWCFSGTNNIEVFNMQRFDKASYSYAGEINWDIKEAKLIKSNHGQESFLLCQIS